MGLFDRFRNAPEPTWTAEQGDDSWSAVKRGPGRQRSGRITGSTRGSAQGVSPTHVNRAGRRQYVRTMQTRQGRMNIVGFGRWRKHREDGEHMRGERVSAVLAPRWVRRIEHGVQYRAHRKNRSTRITPPVD